MSKNIHYSVRMRASKNSVHVSGAEGIYEKDDILNVVKEYTERALTHDKGKADEIRLAVEELKEKPRKISSLPLCTLNTKNPEAVRKAVFKILATIGITERAIEEAFTSLNIGITMRGAMLMDIEGVRLEPDLLRGVRVTRMGITKNADAVLSKQLAKLGLKNDTVQEALILASKVHKYPMVLGELCISDDPNYTTGYIASRSFGYIRLPHIKKRGLPYGGRAFFITGGEVKELIKYLQTTPVLIDNIKPCEGTLTLKEILERKSHRKSHSR
ncbi:MAG: 6-carboxyhexanoate--CoA ligase [Nitrospirae bacterium]|nr:6-carboxyhexanoate--CoA ligase [Nitrospirota bacterium]